MCQYSSVDGEANDWHFTHINSLALSGAAMFCIEATAVEAIGRITPGCLGLYNDATEAALKPILASVRKHSKAAVMMQLAHAGRKASSHTPWDGGQLIPVAEGGWRAEGPSAIPHKEGETPPLAFDAAGLERVRDAFVAAAKRAERLGIDAIEVHSAHGYLLAPVPVADLQPAHRPIWRLACKTACAFRSKCSTPCARRFRTTSRSASASPATDWVEGGWDLAQTIEFAQELKKRGVDWIDASSGGVSPLQKIPLGPGYQVPFAQAIREATGLTTIAVGLITEAEAGRGDRSLRQGRHGRAGARHALRPALGLARRRRTRRPGRSPAAILALAALDAKGAVRRDHVRDAVAASAAAVIPWRRASTPPRELLHHPEF